MLNQSGFDLWADGYDRSVGLSDEENTYPFAGYKRLLGRIYEIVLQKERSTVLDLGFGTGVLTARLYQAGCRICGQDFSARMLSLAREKMPGALLVQGDFSEGLAPILRERRYDFIVSTFALHHLDFAGKCRLIRELLGRLNPGGELLIGDVAFPTQAAQEACRAAAGEEWDEEESYFVYEELKAVFPEAEFKPVSFCAGLLRWRRSAGKAVRWIFFDLGSTLIDETEADAQRIEEMTAGTGITPEAYREKRLECIRQGLPGDPAAISFFGLTKTPWHSELERPWPDAAPVLTELQRRGFRLGVIANQEPGTERRLAAWDLLRYFDVVAASAELGIAKPDPAIFRRALGRAGCAASEAVMVGDRLDNDVAPAKRLGLRTVRVLRGLGVHHSPHSPEEEPEYTIRGLEELLDLFHTNSL